MDALAANRTQSYRPVYDVPREALLGPRGPSDAVLAVVAPVVAYWLFSAFWAAIDWLEIPAIERHRLHEPEELKSRNRVTLGAVIKAVLVQHAIQTALGLLVLEQAVPKPVPHDDRIAAYARAIHQLSTIAFGSRISRHLLAPRLDELASFAYWWAVPALQYIWAFFVMDAWQYFWHRYFHTNRFLYKHIHSVHHRLYVPYACGALYNHPIEGLVLDSVGGLVAHMASRMTMRQACLLFVISTLKTVDDHCGLRLPWDPLQLIFANNADYHDIHHQHFGLKANFSQPFFVHLDSLFGTKMTRDDAAARRRPHTDARDPKSRAADGARRVLKVE